MIPFIIFSLHLLIDIAEGGLLEIQSRDQLKLIKSQSSSLAVLFNAEGAPEQLLLDLREAEEELEEYQIRIVTFSCKKVKVEDCPSHTVLRITSENLYEDFETKYIQGVDSIVGQILTFLLTDKVTLIQEWSSWDQLVAKWKGVSDIVLLYVDPKELKVYRYFMEVAYVFHGKFHFAVTIHRHFEGAKGLQPKEDYGLWYYHCKEVSEQAKDCKYDRTDSSIGGIVDILVFLIGHSYQRISYMDGDGVTLFDKEAAVSVPLKIVYLLTEERSEQAVHTVAEQLTSSLSQLVHFVIIRKELVPVVVLSRFGFSDKEFPPSAAIELRHTDYSGDRYVEQWPPDLEFTLENAKEVVGAIASDADSAFRKTASLYDVNIIDSTKSWKIKAPAIVALGNNDKTCDSFKVNFRRAIRSLYRANSEESTFIFIDYSKDNETYIKLPALRFYSSPEHSVEHEGNFEDIDMLKFMTDHLGIKNVVLLPLSGSDKIPIDASLSTASPDEDEDVAEVEKNEEFQDPDEGDEFLLQQEDDQVSKYMVNSRKRSGQFVEAKEPNVPALTENNFKRTLTNTDLVLVHFYLPWDPRSFSFSKVYAQAADRIAAERQSWAVTTKMAKVNCFDWNTLCHLHNVTAYPRLLVFRNGQCIRHLQGIFSLDALIKAVRLLQGPIVTLIESVRQSVQFAEGSYPVLRGASVSVSVLALLDSEDSQEFKSFLSVAKAMYGTHIFGYTVPTVTNQSCAQFRVKCPSVVVFNRADGQRPLLKTHHFSPTELKTFIEGSSVPAFGELTFETFPQYMALKRPFVILFKEGRRDSSYEPSFKAMAKTELLEQVFLTWMDGTLPVNGAIMQSFVGKEQLPAVVFVDHQQGHFHRYDSAPDTQSVQQWIKRCLEGSVNLNEELKDGKWKPLQKGYDFVHANSWAKETLAESEKREKPNAFAASLTFNSRLKALKKSLTSDSKSSEHDEL